MSVKKILSQLSNLSQYTNGMDTGEVEREREKKEENRCSKNIPFTTTSCQVSGKLIR